MADVRLMLKASREARRINHTHASYTKDGKLMCNLCEILVKTESAWNSHLHSTQHTLRLSRAQDAAAARDANGTGKKRKASTIDSPSPEDRKKAKPANFVPGLDNDEAEVEQPEAPAKAQPAQEEAIQLDGAEDDGVDAAELEALNKELAEIDASAQSANTGFAEPTISAPAMTAEEIATQAREEQSAQRGKRDAELEAEKEDAARLMEDEFEEMEGLEERVKKLREKREALRSVPKRTTAAQEGIIESIAEKPVAHEGQDDEDEDEDEEEEFDDWKFGSG